MSVTHTRHSKLGKHLVARNQRSKFRQRKRPEFKRRECEPERRERESELVRRQLDTPRYPARTSDITVVRYWRLHYRTVTRVLATFASTMVHARGNAVPQSSMNQRFIFKLPLTILTVIFGLDGSLESLAERTDLVADASTGHDLAAVAREPDRMQSMENAITALTA